jgi:pyruvate formate lyase activating enzyme
MKVNLGGIVHLSTVDWPGRASMVVFFRGCPLRCPHCHNRELLRGETFVEYSSVAGQVKRTKGLACTSGSGQATLEEAFSSAAARPFVGALVLSGGEPLMQPEPAAALMRLAKGIGLDVGLETCGYYHEHLHRIIDENLVDKVFLDVKAPLQEDKYKAAAGRKGVAPRVLESLRYCMRSGIPFEVRTTVFLETSSSDLQEIARLLSNLTAEFPGNSLEAMVLQQGRPYKREFEPVSWEHLQALAEAIGGLINAKVRDAPKVKMNEMENSDNLRLKDMEAKG